MRFGLTHHERNRRREQRWQAERQRREQPRTPFALFPTKMDNGEKVWLERYHEQEAWTDCRVCWGSSGWWSTHRRAIR